MVEQMTDRNTAHIVYLPHYSVANWSDCAQHLELLCHPQLPSHLQVRKSLLGLGNKVLLIYTCSIGKDVSIVQYVG